MTSFGLHVDDDELVTCVACGLCLPHCPTYRVTGEETASPRGRIAAMRAVHFGGQPIDEAFTEFMDLCVQCRACEAVCPSSVPFGHLMEGARHTLASTTRWVPWWKRLGLRVLGHHRLLLALSTLLAVAQRLHLLPRRLAGQLPRLPLRRPRLEGTGDDVWLFTGCVMDAWQRHVHAAVLRVATAAATGVALPSGGSGADCCGALHVHAGLAADAQALARRVVNAFPGEATILVDSAGCGAALKDYGRLLGTPEAERFSARVLDVHEWVAGRMDRLAVGPATARFPTRVAVQDPCHLRHVQKAHHHVRTALAPFADLVELDDDGLCCGAGGIYSAEHPQLAGDIRDRKVAAITRTGAPVVASANPGCGLWLAAAGLDVRHPIEIVDQVLTQRNPGGG